MKVAEVDVRACYDTGSQCTLMTESCFQNTLKKQVELQTTGAYGMLTLTAANGTSIPRLGYLVTDVTVRGETVPDVVIIVVEDAAGKSKGPPCILGMNVISRLSQATPIETAPKQKISCTIRSPKTQIQIPALTVVNLEVSTGDASWDADSWWSHHRCHQETAS